MENCKEMRLGEIRLVRSGIDEKFLKTKSGKKIHKKEQVKLVDSNGRETFFYVHRIIGKRYLVLKESRKNSKLSLLDSLQLGFETGVKRRF